MTQLGGGPVVELSCDQPWFRELFVTFFGGRNFCWVPAEVVTVVLGPRFASNVVTRNI